MRFRNFISNSITTILLLSTAICCIVSIYSYDYPTHIINSNIINKSFIKSILKTNTMDLKM